MAEDIKTEKSPGLSAKQANWCLAVCMLMPLSILVLTFVLAVR